MLETPKLTQLGAMLGTPGFMAPEQILGMQLDGRADLYALGCVAWWLLAGREVFARDGGEAKVLHKHIYERAPDRCARVSRLAARPSSRQCSARASRRSLDGSARRCARARRDAARDRDPRRVRVDADARAAAWWRTYQPPKPAAAMPSAEVQVIMPGRTRDQRPALASDERAIAQTIAGPTAIDNQR